MNRFRSSLVLVASCALTSVLASGCGPTVRSSLPPGGSLPSTIAVLPPDYSVDIPRERVDLVHEALITELRNQNFVVVEDRVIRSSCSTPQCPERKRLSQEYLVDAFATVSLSSFSKNNFVAGYYNQLQGEVIVSDTANKELVRVDHTEDESGGLLLQSGQVFQAIISTVKHSGDQVFEGLAERFAKSVVEKFPPHQTETKATQSEGTEIAITSATARWSGPSTYTVCATGTPHSFGYLLRGPNRTPLREISPGKYCGTFSALVTSPESGVEALELRTAFGNSVRQDINLPSDQPCHLTNRLVANSDKSVSVLCSRVGNDPSNENVGCSSTLNHCGAEKIVLFEAPAPSGPYRKMSEVRGSSLKPPTTDKTVAALAVGAGGISSQPEQVPSGN